jgi:hypothetical protein
MLLYICQLAEAAGASHIIRFRLIPEVWIFIIDGATKILMPLNA